MKNAPGQNIRAAGVLLITKTSDPSEFLLLRHPDRWDLPKGHCERGESFRDTALRETEEETGIPPSQIELDDQFIYELTYPVTYRHSGDELFQKQVRYFLGYLESKPKLKLTEHEGSKWFAWQPPHKIQEQTIDPLLEAVANHLEFKHSHPHNGSASS